MEVFLHYDFVGLIFEGACTWRGLFLEFYGILFQMEAKPVKNESSLL